MTKEEAIKVLRDDLKPGDTINCILRHVSRSGMSRSISLLKGDADITYFAALAMGDKIDQKHGGIKIGGCGMDMGFALVYNLSWTLFPEGFECVADAIGPKRGIGCPSNDHSNGDRTYGPDHLHKEGGYAIRHRWL